VVVGGLVAVGVAWPTAPKEHLAKMTPIHLNYAPPRSVRLTPSERKRALDVVGRFVYTAVARNHVERAWNLVAPGFRAGISRKDWNSGNMPVVPFPVASARWKLLYSDASGVGFSIALFPKRDARQPAEVFVVGLHTLGRASRRHWVIDDWQPAPTNVVQMTSGGNGGNGATSMLSQVTPHMSLGTGTAKESTAWLLLPLGLLSLIVLIPLGIAGVNWYRCRRAEALFGR
jgi:hypothetical protein